MGVGSVSRVNGTMGARAILNRKGRVYVVSSGSNNRESNSRLHRGGRRRSPSSSRPRAFLRRVFWFIVITHSMIVTSGQHASSKVSRGGYGGGGICVRSHSGHDRAIFSNGVRGLGVMREICGKAKGINRRFKQAISTNTRGGFPIGIYTPRFGGTKVFTYGVGSQGRAASAFTNSHYGYHANRASLRRSCRWGIRGRVNSAHSSSSAGAGF